MIAIDVTLTSDADPSSEIDTTFRPVPKATAPDEFFEFLKPNSQKIENLFKNCIDQQLVLNTTWIGIPVDELVVIPSNYVTRYYATTPENAQAFLDVFLDMSADFSIKKMWSQYGLKILINQYEIDFDLVEDNFDLIGEDGKIWGVDFKN